MDIKRTILWLVFSLSLLLLWDHWMLANGKPSLFSPAPTQKTDNTKSSSASNTSAVPSASTTAINNAATIANNVVTDATMPAKGEIVTITTDVFKADIDTLGGQLKRLELLKHKEGNTHKWYEPFMEYVGLKKPDVKNNVVLFDAARHYIAQTGLINAAGAVDVPNHKSLFIAQPGSRNLDKDNALQLVLESEKNGVKLTKIYTFKRADYNIELKHIVSNGNAAAITPSLYLQLQHDGNTPEGGSQFFGTATTTSPVVYTDAEKYQKLDFKKIGTAKDEHASKADNGWVAIIQHFFVSAFIPADKAQREIYTKKVDTNSYAIGNILPLGTIAPGASATMDAHLYSGPQESALLEKIAPGLELVKDYGWLTIIAKPIFWLMDQIHKMLGNWGWAIIIFTIFIKLLFFPLSAAGYRSMAKMKVLSPKMQAIRERHKSDPQKMNQAMLELYRSEKANPMGGCLPILVQMPVFIALYWVLQASVEMRNAPWLGWIQDLAAPDPLFILPVLMAISMFVQTKLNPAPPDPIQAKMMMIMPLVFSAMFFFFPSGLVLYYVVNNILSIAQQWVITNKIENDKSTRKK